jgi:hypothetical protein
MEGLATSALPGSAAADEGAGTRRIARGNGVHGTTDPAARVTAGRSRLFSAEADMKD